MKKIALLFILAVILVLSFACGNNKNESADGIVPKTNLVPETNLDGLRVLQHPENTITYGSGVTESISDNPIFLYVNGSLKNTSIIENGIVLVPLQLITETLGVKFYQDDVADQVSIIDGENRIVLKIGDDKPTFNDKVIPVDVAPKIVNGDTYVSVEFITKLLDCKVEQFDGNPSFNGDGVAPQEPHYPIGEKQVMVSRYPTDAIALSEATAIQKLEEQLIIAYENTYGIKFKPLSTEPRVSWDAQSDLQYTIPNLSISYENDRFFVINFGWNFMVDKYTSTIFLSYNGIPSTINIFNPYSPEALAFAG